MHAISQSYNFSQSVLSLGLRLEYFPYLSRGWHTVHLHVHIQCAHIHHSTVIYSVAVSDIVLQFGLEGLSDLYITNTIFTQSDAVATIYFSCQFCTASIRERWLLESSVYLTQWKFSVNIYMYKKHRCQHKQDGGWRNPLPEGRWGGWWCQRNCEKRHGHSYPSATCCSSRSGRCRPLHGYRRERRGVGLERINFRRLLVLHIVWMELGTLCLFFAY